ncbi:hypothetical protein F5Y16DRAFT_410093 [Xylariaceae sp. FL0255]|nr:hypothetical protein F5Y16DRAFT_410093 [Xylariaceae sp. FL0255]
MGGTRQEQEDEQEDETPPAINHSSRIKRNTACTSCRDAKVRTHVLTMLTSSLAALTCVVTNATSNYSKIEELVQEIETIKQSVGSAAATNRPYFPPRPQHNVEVPPGAGELVAQQLNASSPSAVPAQSGSGARTGHTINGVPGTSETPNTSTTTGWGANFFKPADPSPPRALGSTPFSGEDIDYYFQMYFEHLHTYMPIVRHRDPNKCYESCPLLFWTIIYVAVRRYKKNDALLPFLVDEVQKQSLAAMTKMPLSLATINALILICSWMWPIVRFVVDQASLYTSVMGNAAVLLGIHTGKASHPEYSHGPFQSNFTDEEATFTWAGLNIVCQRVSSYLGLPPITALFNHTIQNTIDGRLPFHVPSGFRVLLECQKFCHRANKIVAANLEESSGVSTHVVQVLEDEWLAVQGFICSERADDLDRFNSMLVLLEIQTFYMIPPQGYNPQNLKKHVLRAFNTASAVFRAALELDEKMGFLYHLTHFHLRSFATASCVIFKTLRLAYMQYLDRNAIEQAAATDAIEVCSRAIISEGDLPSRLCALLKASLEFIRGHSAEWMAEPPSTDFPHRLSASVAFDCFIGWKKDSSLRELLLQQQQARESKEQQLREQRQQREKQQEQQQEQKQLDQSSSAVTDTLLPATLPDPFAIDWTFMDDFEWESMEPPIMWNGMAR